MASSVVPQVGQELMWEVWSLSRGIHWNPITKTAQPTPRDNAGCSCFTSRETQKIKFNYVSDISLNSSLCYRTDRRLTRCNMFALFLAESSLFSHVSFNNARNVLMQPPPKKINKNYPNPNKTKEITQRLKIQLTFQYPSSAAPGVPFRKSLICILKFWVYSGPRSFLLDCLT